MIAKMMDESYKGRERRVFQRVKVGFPLTYEVRSPLEVRDLVSSREVDALMLDIGEGGMGILTTHEIPPSTILSAKFTFINYYLNTDDHVSRIETICEVRYNISLEKKEYRLGVCFTQIPERDKSMIASFVKMAPAVVQT